MSRIQKSQDYYQLLYLILQGATYSGQFFIFKRKKWVEMGHVFLFTPQGL